MVEQLTLNQLVRGSSPRGATKFCFFPVTLTVQRSAPRRRSSMVEHLFCKQAVAGSNPIAGSTSPAVSAEQLQLLPLPGGVMVAQQILNLFV